MNGASRLQPDVKQPFRTRLKVCCISSIEEARLAAECGADALGLVAAMPSGPGPIPDELIAAIAPTVPPGVATFLLTQERTADAIIDHVRRTGVNTVQIVNDDIDFAIYEPIRVSLPNVRIVQVVHVRDWKSLDRALEFAPFVDALLLDSGDPLAKIQELGGTGRVHDWAISQQIVQHSPKPVYLAGGVHPGNVATAIQEVRPFGIDLCSGVRTNKKLDREKLMRLVAAMQTVDSTK
ncbi:phosphoribosylanthranilate isomerase [Thalassoglobus sp. JC818]|uniref:phosphoribosylanthranilate isomerase n=1 Tax=Thalassoglobus sp. JC818 TaxID=3232136 RepID=UPI00345A0485